MYRLMAARDPGAEGVFVVAVRTTGVFCRATCRPACRSPRTSISMPPPGTLWSPGSARAADAGRWNHPAPADRATQPPIVSS